MSSIVNLISPKSVDFLKTILTSTQLESAQNTEIPSLTGLSEEAIKVFNDIIKDR